MHVRLHRRALVPEIIKLTAQIGASGAGGHIGGFTVPTSRDASCRESLWADLVQRLRRLADSANDAGLDYLLFENLAFGVPS